jgi:hypothetical protein
MYIIILAIVILTILSSIFVLINFIYFLFKSRIITNRKYFKFIEFWTVTILPIIFLSFFDIPQINDCCSDSAIFSPDHRIGIYLLLILYTFAYTISIFRKQILTPILELFISVFLIFGLIINILLCIHLTTDEEWIIYWVFGNIPIIMLLLIKLYNHQILIKSYILENRFEQEGLLNNISVLILKLNPLMKYPILILLLIPIIVLISLFLMLFGQKPDAMIRAFTDTYKHGFSQLDYMCDNVNCGGHFLCSVGANGHKRIVRPIRMGERNGCKIVCNRQLLISNAFEELIQEKTPKIHRFIRKNYNKVGNIVHRYYYVFNIKIISDTVYVIMKPLEWFFLLILYTFDGKPENRIAVQYLNKKDREYISKTAYDNVYNS